MIRTPDTFLHCRDDPFGNYWAQDVTRDLGGQGDVEVSEDHAIDVRGPGELHLLGRQCTLGPGWSHRVTTPEVLPAQAGTKPNLV